MERAFLMRERGNKKMKKRLLPLMLLAGGSLFAETHFSIGVGVGAPAYYPPPPPPIEAVPPSYSGPANTWVDGYWNNGGSVDGYWAPPYSPYYGQQYAYPHGRDWDDDDYDRGHGWDRGDYRGHDRGHEREREHDRGRGFEHGFRR